jgi:hypothetical protein
VFTDKEETIMSTYGLEEVIRRWERGGLTVEQAIGQILLLLQDIEERLRELERKIFLLMQQRV